VTWLTPDQIVQELKEATEERYYRFREDELLNLTDPETGCELKATVRNWVKTVLHCRSISWQLAGILRKPCRSRKEKLAAASAKGDEVSGTAVSAHGGHQGAKAHGPTPGSLCKAYEVIDA